MDEAHLETLVVHAGRGRRGPGAPMSVPPVLTSTYVAGGEIHYAREGNPTWSALEEALGALEGGRALVFSSGLAAIAAVLRTLRTGAVVVAAGNDGYLGTRALLGRLDEAGSLVYRPVDVTDTGAVVDALPGAALLLVESLTNPLLGAPDIRALAEAAHDAGARIAVDATFMTPFLQRPLELGADVVLHSATKFLSGHSDVVMGAAATNDDEWYERVREQRTYEGAIPGPLEVFLALRGLRTLGVRLERAQGNAGRLAARLEGHPAVVQVNYPGIGWMVAFDLGARERADEFCAAVRVAVPATSLGGVETTVERRARWEGEEHLPPGLIRMSVGIEDVDDLWADLAAAL